MRRLVLSLLVLAGCATAPVPSAAPQWKLLSATPDVTEIQFQTGDSLNRATVTDSGARGPFVDLKRAEGKLQGTLRVDWPVDLQRKDSDIHGRVAGDAFDLTLSPDGDETRATGLTRGMPTTFWLSPQKIRGTIGECRFDLVWGSGRYTGGRTCGARSETVTWLIPAALATWSDPEVAALLVMISTRS
jgi:hypothetical protein